MKSCFLTDGPGPFPPPSVKIHESAHGKHSVLITTAQYRVRDIGLPIKGLHMGFAAPADLSPESSLCIHEMPFFGLFL